MNDDTSTPPEQPPEQPQAKPRWQPICSIDRRVLGVLVEKAKTTPDAYPLSMAAIGTAANQKSNRSPLMELDVDDLEESLERLREMGAVGLIEGHGRVSKYRHYLYEWLAVDKVEVAVMAELLLRGDQTEGALRGRASRMEPITDLGDLRPVLASLRSKGLVVSLTPEGRGHVVTHGLYLPGEMQRVKAGYAAGQASAPASEPVARVDTPPSPAPVAPPVVDRGEIPAMRREIEDLRSKVTQLGSDVETLSDALRRSSDELSNLRDALGG
jgi:uncharacterized protein YceH (UPF0502 family)